MTVYFPYTDFLELGWNYKRENDVTISRGRHTITGEDLEVSYVITYYDKTDKEMYY